MYFNYISYLPAKYFVYNIYKLTLRSSDWKWPQSYVPKHVAGRYDIGLKIRFIKLPNWITIT
jgi:hypothetical protein